MVQPVIKGLLTGLLSGAGVGFVVVFAATQFAPVVDIRPVPPDVDGTLIPDSPRFTAERPDAPPPMSSSLDAAPTGVVVALAPGAPDAVLTGVEDGPVRVEAPIPPDQGLAPPPDPAPAPAGPSTLVATAPVVTATEPPVAPLPDGTPIPTPRPVVSADPGAIVTPDAPPRPDTDVASVAPVTGLDATTPEIVQAAPSAVLAVQSSPPIAVPQAATPVQGDVKPVPERGPVPPEPEAERVTRADPLPIVEPDAGLSVAPPVVSGTPVPTPDAVTIVPTAPVSPEEGGPSPDLPSTDPGAAVAEVAPGTRPEPGLPDGTPDSDAAPAVPVRVSAAESRLSVTRIETGGASLIPLDPEDGTPDPETSETIAGLGRAIEAFAVPFEAAGALPRLSVVLLDTEARGKGIDLSGLSFPFAVAIDPLAPDALLRMTELRDVGLEVLALAPVLAEATPLDLEVAFDAFLRAVPQAVAVMDMPDARLQDTRQRAIQVADILSAGGHGVVTYDKGLNALLQVAERVNLPAINASAVFDTGDSDARRMQRFLDRGAFVAGQDGHALVVGHLRAETLEALAAWQRGNRASTVQLVPTSAVLLRK